MLKGKPGEFDTIVLKRDFQPNGEHVETICLISKGDVKSQKLRVEFSLEDMDTDGFKKGATYNAIRDWIKEKYGYRVTNLNIAQVKQKKEFDELYLRNADGEAVVRRISKSVPSDFTVEPIHNKPIYDSGILNVFYVKKNAVI